MTVVIILKLGRDNISQRVGLNNLSLHQKKASGKHYRGRITLGRAIA